MAQHQGNPAEDNSPDPPLPFRQRAIYVVAVVTIVVVALAMLWIIRWVFCLAFLAILFGVFLRAGADLLASVMRPLVRLTSGVSLALFCLLLVSLVALFFVLAVPALSQQVALLRDQVPQSVERLKDKLRETEWGVWLVEEGEAMVGQVRPDTRPAGANADPADPATMPVIEPAGVALNVPAVQPNPGDSPGTSAARSGGAGSGSGAAFDLPGFFRQAVGWATTAVTGVIALLFIIFTGLYLAIDPGLYARGVLWLVPPRGRDKADCVLRRVGHTLRYWILGQLAAMTLVGTVAGVGLWILGAPLPLVLGVLAGVAEFVPNVGPFVAAVLPTLLSVTAEGRFLDGPSLGVAVLVLFVAIQTAESYLITPMIQQRAVEIPPALLIVTQLAAAVLLGPIGVVIAAPLVASVMAAIKELVVVGDPKREHPKDRANPAPGEV